MLTALDTEADAVQGLEAGADDYVTKPFGLAELRSRIRAVLRRAGPRALGREVLSIGPVTLDRSHREATVDGEQVKLTFSEFELLGQLMSEPGRLFNRQELLRAIWGDSAYRDPRAIDVHIRHLREKIEQRARGAEADPHRARGRLPLPGAVRPEPAEGLAAGSGVPGPASVLPACAATSSVCAHACSWRCCSRAPSPSPSPPSPCSPRSSTACEPTANEPSTPPSRASRAELAEIRLDPTTSRPSPPELAASIALLRRRSGAQVTVLGRRLETVYAPVNQDLDVPDYYAQVDRALRTGRGVHSLIGNELVAAEPMQIGKDGPIDAVVLVRRLEYVSSAVRAVRTAFIDAAAVGFAVALLLGLALTTTLLRRLERLREAAGELERRGLEAPIHVDERRDEIGDLTRAFASMQARLRRQEEARQAFVATASHELRTPLASLDGTLELLEDDLQADTLDLQDARERAVRAREQSSPPVEPRHRPARPQPPRRRAAAAQRARRAGRAVAAPSPPNSSVAPTPVACGSPRARPPEPVGPRRTRARSRV